jgi:hypothetical protein
MIFAISIRIVAMVIVLVTLRIVPHLIFAIWVNMPTIFIL